MAQGEEENRREQFFKRLWLMLGATFLQKKMHQDMVAAVMHYVIFYGFLIVTLGTLETILQGFFPDLSFERLIGENRWYWGYLVSQDIANFIVALAILFALTRRLYFPPERLKKLTKSSKKDAYLVLSLILGLVLTELVVLGCDVFLFGRDFLVFSQLTVSLLTQPQITGFYHWQLLQDSFWWLHLLFLCGFIVFLPFSKHQHLVWVWPNMFFMNLKSSGRIRPMKFNEDADFFGVGKPADFTWKQFLDGKTCVECGRCSSVCPATKTGKPLEPQKMIHHIKSAFHSIEPGKSREDQLDLVPNFITSEELWGCTTCGACMKACPLGIDHISPIIDMRRYLNMTLAEFPSELEETFRNLEMYGNPWGFHDKTRADWAKNLDVPVASETEGPIELLYWVGCAGSFDKRNQEISTSVVKLLKKAKIKFAILGAEERCTGDAARRLGNEYLAQTQIAENISVLKKYSIKKIITACPHCFNTLKNEYPDFGLNLQVLHHSEFFADLVDQGKLFLPKHISQKTMTFHDSCYLGRHNEIYDAPRKLIKQSALEFKELPRSHDQGFCCGAGGGRMWLEEKDTQKINEERAKEVLSTGVESVATACPFCLTMLTDGIKSQNIKKSIVVKDVAEWILEEGSHL